MNVATWLRTMYRAEYRPPPTDGSYYCTEYIGMLLQESGVISKRYNPGSFQPWEMVRGNFGELASHLYRKPIRMKVER